MKVKCIRNESTSLPYIEGLIYEATEIHAGMYSIQDAQGDSIIAPLSGHLLTFIKV